MLNQNVEKNLEQFNGRSLGRYRAWSFICRGGRLKNGEMMVKLFEKFVN